MFSVASYSTPSASVSGCLPCDLSELLDVAVSGRGCGCNKGRVSGRGCGCNKSRARTGASTSGSMSLSDTTIIALSLAVGAGVYYYIKKSSGMPLF